MLTPVARHRPRLPLWPLALAGIGWWGVARWRQFAALTPGIDAQTAARLARHR